MSDTKRCGRCNKYLPLHCFDALAAGDGTKIRHRKTCRECNKACIKNYYKKQNRTEVLSESQPDVAGCMKTWGWLYRRWVP